MICHTRVRVAKSQTRGASEQARADDEEHNLLEDISNPREWKFHSASASEMATGTNIGRAKVVGE
jgi:hypothetical protein